MWEVIPFSNQTNSEPKGQLARAMDLKIASSEVIEETEKTWASIFRWLFPQYFMTPSEIVAYLEWRRQQELQRKENKPLLEQITYEAKWGTQQAA